MTHLGKAAKKAWQAMSFDRDTPGKLKRQELKSEVERLAGIIGVPVELLPTFGYSSLEDVSFLFHDADGYQLGYRERGQVSKTTYASRDDLLFAVFESITQSMATSAVPPDVYQDDTHDSRRFWFPKQVDLMCRLSTEWGEREVQRQDAVLKKYPFDDTATARADLSSTFRDQGYCDETAWTLACQRYPLPSPSQTQT